MSNRAPLLFNYVQFNPESCDTKIDKDQFRTSALIKEILRHGDGVHLVTFFAYAVADLLEKQETKNPM